MTASLSAASTRNHFARRSLSHDGWGRSRKAPGVTCEGGENDDEVKLKRNEGERERKRHLVRIPRD